MSDLISRQVAIDAIFSEPLYESGMKKRDADAVVPAIYEKIKLLPSAQPERKNGEWIHKPDIYLDEQTWECSECGEPWIFIEGTPSENNANFCPNCGAKMSHTKEKNHDT